MKLSRSLSAVITLIGMAPTMFWPGQLFALDIKVSTTTIYVSICGDGVVNEDEECDVVPPQTGQYSQSIAGRQCDYFCKWGPYCGDGILQTLYDEECDDGNNDNGDFCSEICKIEPAASGGGSSSGGGSGGSGGSTEDLGDTVIDIQGYSYPQRTLNILLDGDAVGSVRADRDGKFTFSIDASPGATTLGFWATDNTGVRSITLTTTFDVTQGAITDIKGVLLPPTLFTTDQTVDPGDVVTLQGQAIPGVEVEVYVNDKIFTTAVANDEGIWTVDMDTSSLSLAEHIIKARYYRGSNTLRSDSSFSTALQLFVGVDGQPANNSDLNRDGRVDLIDFSILIYWWQTNGGTSDPPADINQNGNVGLEDFSILLFNWTG